MPQNLAEVFHALHHGVNALVLPNAWDAGSARLMESIGAQAIATTSAGAAWAHGYPDGDILPVPVLLASIREIARVVRVPLSADIEGGFSNDLAEVEETIAQVLDAGAVGINIEDGDGTPELLCAKIERARRAGDRAGVRVFVNARTDVYLKALVPPEQRVEATLARAAKYRAAGADGIFVPAVLRAGEIRALAEALGLPMNVLALPGAPGLAELETLGVKRLSAGSGIARALYNEAADLAKSFLREGKLESHAKPALGYPEINQLMTL